MMFASRLGIAARRLPSSFAATQAHHRSAVVVALRGLATKVGDAVPSVDLYKGFPPEKINLKDFCQEKKKVILLGLPGAFTPTWSTKQIPNYMENQDALRELGIESVVVWCVNDPAVMLAWAKNQKVGLSMLQLMGDPKGELTSALGMAMNHPGPESKGLFGRCKRHAIYVDNGIISAINISEADDDPAGDADPSNTLADAMIEAIKAATTK